MKNRILTVALVLSVLLSLAACKGDAALPTDAADERTAVTGSEEKAPKESAEDLTEDGKATEESSSEPTEPGTEKTEPTAPTEPATETTAPATQPTQPTQPTIPVVTEPPHQHSYSATVIAPTCNEKGYTKYTCACGYSYNDTYTDALGHHFIDEVVAPTSSEQGYTKHTCDRCWYSYNDTYTDPVKVVYDINAAMEKANAYALSLGFACIDYSLTPENAGYYPPTYAEGRIIEMVGGQEWLEQETMAGALCCKNDLEGGWGTGEHTKCACRAYITYDAAADAYTIYFLYA